MELYYFMGIIEFYSFNDNNTSESQTRGETPRNKVQNISDQKTNNIYEKQHNLYHKIN